MVKLWGSPLEITELIGETLGRYHINFFTFRKKIILEFLEFFIPPARKTCILLVFLPHFYIKPFILSMEIKSLCMIDYFISDDFSFLITRYDGGLTPVVHRAATNHRYVEH